MSIVLCLLLPIIYLLLNYSDSHKKINEVYHNKFAARKSRQVPVLVDGESFQLLQLHRSITVYRLF